MSVETTFRLVCDAQECAVGGPISLRGAPDAWNRAKKAGWVCVQIHSCGASLNFCEDCADVITTCKVCEKRTYDPRIALCGCCGWKDTPG